MYVYTYTDVCKLGIGGTSQPKDCLWGRYHTKKFLERYYVYIVHMWYVYTRIECIYVKLKVAHVYYK